MNEERQNSRNGILSLTIKDKAVLYSAYMPFLQYGGLFVPTNKAYDIGDEVFMLLTLMDEPEKIPIAGKVVCVTQRGAQGNRTAGIGVQFAAAKIIHANVMTGFMQDGMNGRIVSGQQTPAPQACLLITPIRTRDGTLVRTYRKQHAVPRQQMGQCKKIT